MTQSEIVEERLAHLRQACGQQNMVPQIAIMTGSLASDGKPNVCMWTPKAVDLDIPSIKRLLQHVLDQLNRIGS